VAVAFDHSNCLPSAELLDRSKIYSGHHE
jgi:hypothetical protein